MNNKPVSLRFTFEKLVDEYNIKLNDYKDFKCNIDPYTLDLIVTMKLRETQTQ